MILAFIKITQLLEEVTRLEADLMEKAEIELKNLEGSHTFEDTRRIEFLKGYIKAKRETLGK